MRHEKAWYVRGTPRKPGELEHREAGNEWRKRRRPDPRGLLVHCKEFEFYPECDGISWRVLYRE